MNFYEITCEAACAANVPVRHREDVLGVIARQAVHDPLLKELGEKRIYEALLEREHQGSTGFGEGVAIPHARFEELEAFRFFIVTSRHPVDFEAIDRRKVSVFLVMLGPADQVKEHLRTLAAVSTILTRTNVKEELRLAETGAVLYETFLRRTKDEKPARFHEKQKLLTVVLYEDDFFYGILEYLLQEGIDGATVIDSLGMGHYISSMPLFASFVSFMNEDHNRSRTILAPVPEEQVERLVEGIEEITGDLDKTQGAMILVLDLTFAKGSMKML